MFKKIFLILVSVIFSFISLSADENELNRDFSVNDYIKDGYILDSFNTYNQNSKIYFTYNLVKKVKNKEGIGNIVTCVYVGKEFKDLDTPVQYQKDIMHRIKKLALFCFYP
tara:strand:+ start:559 stop:891 length:333 start_codon:yes stop_codon:yes gene_type:complete